MESVIVFICSTVIMNCLFMILKHGKIAEGSLAVSINVFRCMFSCTSATLFLLQMPLGAYYTYVAGLSMYTVNTPMPMKIRVNKRDRLQLQLISDSFFTVPILFALMYSNHPSYQNLVDIMSRFKCLTLETAQAYEQKIAHMNPAIIFACVVLEFYCATYPSVRFGRRNPINVFTRLFTTLLGIFYALAGSAGMDFSFSPLFYRHATSKFLMSAADYLLLVSIALSLFTAAFGLIPKHLYANTLSTLNFCCGWLAVIYMVRHPHVRPLLRVPLYIMAGQFADLFDGRAAEKWGSTKHGEMFDDVADFVSFAVATGFLTYRIVSQDLQLHPVIGAIFGIFYGTCIAYRLIRFVVNKRKAGQVTGVKYFQGLPSPGAATIVIVISMLIQIMLEKNQISLNVARVAYFTLVPATALLATSYIKYAHPGRTFFKLSRKSVVAKILALYFVYLLVAFVKSFFDKNYAVPFMIALFGCVNYLLTPLYIYKTGIFDGPVNGATTSEDEEDAQKQE